ncbi:hypothetical protein [Burkholderia cenocepacia]|uniref:hypothetical protein n=1 Tax=Burkholderia cenocepacia TaxID=95486 RepID=UPI0007621A54|nr:hypothetical protein [Burkholderia cenocepacia]KWU19116.1 hypothetical protein AS149_12780 [Burkholderia cenocepacia]
MWPVEQFPATPEHPFGTQLNYEETLFFYEEPLLFTTLHGGQVYLACASATEGSVNRYLVAKISAVILDGLKADRLPVFAGLDQPELWLVDQRFDGSIEEVRQLPCLDAVPDDYRPSRDVYLRY